MGVTVALLFSSRPAFLLFFLGLLFALLMIPALLDVRSAFCFPFFPFLFFLFLQF